MTMEVTSYELDIDYSVIERFSRRELTIEELANLLAEKGFTIVRFSTVSITLSTKLTQGKNEVTVEFKVSM